jgi:peptide/nickel transport system permease protein
MIRRTSAAGRLVRSPLGLAGTVILGVVGLLVALGPELAPYDPQAFHMRHRLEGPSAAFWFGTDNFGRDVFSRVLAGARSTVMFGVVATALGTGVGTLIGLLSGYAGGRMDETIMRAVDALLAIPNLLLTLLIVTALGASTTNAVLAVGLAFAPGMARIARSVTLSVRTRDFVAAALARGEGAGYIMLREILPNVAAPVIVEGSIRVAFAIMLGATLSFLGLGAQPPASDWGLMVAEARAHMFRNPWLVVWPGVGIALVAIGFNLFGDGLRDALNPRVAR